MHKILFIFSLISFIFKLDLRLPSVSSHASVLAAKYAKDKSVQYFFAIFAILRDICGIKNNLADNI